METGAITGYIDVAQIVLYTFWVFFALLILYLRREDKREGYPLESDRRGGVRVRGYPDLPAPKTFHLQHGGTRSAPRTEPPRPELAMVPAAKFPGAPMVPTGDPMQDGVGPAAYAMREDAPDLTHDGHLRLQPLRLLDGYGVASEDPDPRGMTVVDVQGKPAGTIKDVWLDRSEMIFRYLEAEPLGGGTTVLVPLTMARVNPKQRSVKLASIMWDQLGKAPQLQRADMVTLREEDRICAYFASGHLYAYPGRTESML